jgi:hypothetical protein
MVLVAVFFYRTRTFPVGASTTVFSDDKPGEVASEKVTAAGFLHAKVK